MPNNQITIPIAPEDLSSKSQVLNSCETQIQHPRSPAAGTANHHPLNLRSWTTICTENFRHVPSFFNRSHNFGIPFISGRLGLPSGGGGAISEPSWFGKRHLKTEPNKPTVVKWDIAWTCFKTSLHLEWHKSMVGIWQLLSCMSSVSPKRSLCLSPLCGSCVTRCFRKCPKVRNARFPPMSTAALDSELCTPSPDWTFPLPSRLAVLRHASNAKISCLKSQISGHLGTNFYAFSPLRADQGHLLWKKLHALRLPEAPANVAVNSDDIR